MGPRYRRGAVRVAARYPITSAMVQGHSPRPAASTAPTPPPTIPGIFTGGAPTSPTPSFPAPVVTRNPAAAHLNPPSGSSTGTFTPADGPTSTTGSSTIPENASSLPSTTVSGGLAAFSFPYFQLYTLDDYNGVVLYPGQYQQATLGGSVNLMAQVSRSSAPYTYSWTTSGLTTATGITGASTADLQFSWQGSNSTAAVEPVTLTVTDTNSHQESQTYDFVVPTTNVVTLPSSASWPTTIPPDLVESGAPSIGSQGVSVDAVSGALDTSINLPSYNPNVQAISLTYNSSTANPLPIVLVPHRSRPA